MKSYRSYPFKKFELTREERKGRIIDGFLVEYWAWFPEHRKNGENQKYHEMYEIYITDKANPITNKNAEKALRILKKLFKDKTPKFHFVIQRGTPGIIWAQASRIIYRKHTGGAVI
jgi:hypothetical protein